MSTRGVGCGLGLSTAAIACTRREPDLFFMIASRAGSAGFPAFASEDSAGLDLFWPDSQDSLSRFSAFGNMAWRAWGWARPPAPRSPPPRVRPPGTGAGGHRRRRSPPPGAARRPPRGWAGEPAGMRIPEGVAAGAAGSRRGGHGWARLLRLCLRLRKAGSSCSGSPSGGPFRPGRAAP